MGPRDEELVREAFEHWNRGEWEAALEHVDPDVEWRTATPLLDLPQVSHGHDGVRAFWQSWSSSWTNIRVEPEEFIPAGDELLVLVRWRATSEAGIEVDQPVAFRFLIEDERTTRFISYGSGRRPSRCSAYPLAADGGRAATLARRAPVAQLDRASVYGTEGLRFES
jgi:ketosteroid isomerase-like protein